MSSPPTSKRSTAAVTMHAVAKQAGVSPMSVSNVINGRRVRPETRDAVLLAIEALDYTPNVAARALASASPVRIGLLYNNPESAFVSALLVGAIDAATRFGAQLLIRRYEERADFTLADTLRDMTREGGANALVLTAPYCEAISGTGLAEQLNVPITALCAGSDLPDMQSVRIDDVEAAREMTEYLLGLGHRRIGFIRGAASHIISRTRYDGYCLAHRQNGVEIDPLLVVDGDLTFDSGLDAADRLLALQSPPTAIFASNDDMAAAVISVAHRRSIPVPEHLSVAGFDDSPISRKIWPALTTIRQPIVDMTSTAIEALVAARGNRRSEGPPLSICADHALMIRGSTAPPPDGAGPRFGRDPAISTHSA